MRRNSRHLSGWRILRDACCVLLAFVLAFGTTCWTPLSRGVEEAQAQASASSNLPVDLGDASNEPSGESSGDVEQKETDNSNASQAGEAEAGNSGEGDADSNEANAGDSSNAGEEGLLPSSGVEAMGDEVTPGESEARDVIDEDYELASLEITYLPSPDQGDEGHDPLAAPKKYDPNAVRTESNTPAIEYEKGKLRLGVNLVYERASDGSVKVVPADASAGINWEIIETLDDENKLTTDSLAKVEKAYAPEGSSDALVTAYALGNGSLTVRCSAQSDPSCRVDVKVNIKNNQHEGPHEDAEPVSAQLCYKTAEMDSFAVYVSDSETPAYIDTTRGSCWFDVRIGYDDGSFAMASKVNMPVTWGFTSSSYAKYASIDENGKMTALNKGNSSNVRVAATIEGLTVSPVSARVKITNNSQTAVVPQNMGIRYRDWKTLPSVTKEYSSSNVPQIVLVNGNRTAVQLFAPVTWSDGRQTTSADTFVRAWSVGWCTDLQGNPSSTICTVDQSGYVQASGSQGGYAYITCKASSPNHPGVTYEQTVKVEIHINEKYVKSMQIVDLSGKSFGTGKLLREGENLLPLAVKATYVTYDPQTGRQVEEVRLSSVDEVDNLFWKSCRGESDERELYSYIDHNGVFHANQGFRSARVVATLKGASFFGGDVTADLWVSQESTEDIVGVSSSMKVKVYHISEYDTLGDQAPIAREVEVSRAQLEALGSPYSDWYTFHYRGDSFATVYARGVSITNFLSVCGIDSSDLRYMEFKGSDSYTATDGFYSAEVILGTQYRYSNYYMHKVSESPHYLGQSNVAPMIALDWYIDRSNDYDGSGWAKMESESTLRIVQGMSNVDARNAGKSVSAVNEVIVIIADQPDEDSGAGGGGTGGGAGGSGTGSDSGGGSGDNQGEAIHGQGGGEGQGGQAASSASQGVGSLLLYELTDATEQHIAKAELDNQWRPVAVVLAIVFLLLGAFVSNRRYKQQLEAGRRATPQAG